MRRKEIFTESKKRTVVNIIKETGGLRIMVGLEPIHHMVQEINNNELKEEQGPNDELPKPKFAQKENKSFNTPLNLSSRKNGENKTTQPSRHLPVQAQKVARIKSDLRSFLSTNSLGLASHSSSSFLLHLFWFSDSMMGGKGFRVVWEFSWWRRRRMIRFNGIGDFWGLFDLADLKINFMMVENEDEVEV